MLDVTINKNTSCFGQYGKSFQEKIFQCLLSDRNWSSQMCEVMTSDYFDLQYLKYLTSKYFVYYEKYKDFPTLNLLISIVRDDLREGKDIILRDQIVEFLHRIKSNPDMGDLAYVKDKSLDFCKRQALKGALEQAVLLVSTSKYEGIVDLMKEAIAVGSPSTLGHNFFEDMDARFVKVNRGACPTGIAQLDQKDILDGGLGRGEIGVVTANTGVGKSHWLVEMGANAMRVGKNVIHYTFELSETAVGIRYDSNLCGIPSTDVRERKKEVIKKYQDLELGNLIIKEFPTGSATVLTLRSHLEKLMLKSFVPSLIIIDYADIMRATRRLDSLRHELKLIYEELRNLAMELKVPIWTASQANRDSANASVVGLENMSEAYGKAMIADVVISISRKPMEKANGSGRLFVAKNRAGRDGILFPIYLDTSMSKIHISEDTEELSLEEIVKSDNDKAKKLLKEKWQEINGA